jgi:hypothetical protein
VTRLTIVQAPALEFSVQGRNATTDTDDEGLVFYDDVSKVHVLPDEQNFTIQAVEAAIDGVSPQTHAAATIKPESGNMPEQVPSRPDQRPS